MKPPTRIRLLPALCLTSVALLVSCSSTTSSPNTSPTVSPSGATVSSAAPVGLASDSMIVQLQMASSLTPAGAAANPTTVFNQQTDRKIVAVVTLAGQNAGTKLSYVRYLDGKYVDSKSATVVKTSRYFYFNFDALPGKNFTAGHYRLRLYVNERAVREAEYQVQ